jgi:hypothetical protein
MALRSFAVVGDALNFSARRFETVLRLATIPLILLLVFNMAATFGYLSVASGRIITFRDVAAAGASWAQVAKLGENAAASGLAGSSAPIWGIYLASLAINAVIVSSFMAPLIRYAGLGERPAAGLVRLPFGPDQFRFIGAGILSFLLSALVVYAPIGAATFFIIGIVSTAVAQPYAHFPDDRSLHTIDVISGREALDMRGGLWLYDYGYWSAAAMVVALLLAVVLILHLRPRREEARRGIGSFGRILFVLSGLAAYFAAAAFAALQVAALMAGGDKAALLAIALFAAAALASAAFLNLRLYPYVGVAVCRRSMGFGGAFRVTRRFDVFRLGLAFILLGLILFLMQMLLVWIGGGAALAMLGALAVAVRSYVRLVTEADGGAWVMPFFGWLWAFTGIVFTLLWTAFTYGVAAGLWGRLYRESEK